jgi:hypothetical protein
MAVNQSIKQKRGNTVALVIAIMVILTIILTWLNF